MEAEGPLAAAFVQIRTSPPPPLGVTAGCREALGHRSEGLAAYGMPAPLPREGGGRASVQACQDRAFQAAFVQIPYIGPFWPKKRVPGVVENPWYHWNRGDRIRTCDLVLPKLATVDPMQA